MSETQLKSNYKKDGRGNMTVNRIDKNNGNDGFTQISNNIINDNRLDLKEKGLMLHFLSKPEGWVINVDEVASANRDGKTAIYNGLKKLKELGYLALKPIYNSRNKIEKWNYTINEAPIIPLTIFKNENLNVENLNVENVQIENSYYNKTNYIKTKEERKKEVEEKKKVTEISEAKSYQENFSEEKPQLQENNFQEKIKPEVKIVSVKPEYEVEKNKFFNTASEILGPMVEHYAAKKNHQKHAVNDLHTMIDSGLLGNIDDEFIYSAATDVINGTKIPDFYLQDFVTSILARLRQFRAETNGNEKWVVEIINKLDEIQAKRLQQGGK